MKFISVFQIMNFWIESPCTYIKLGFPDSSVGKESAWNAGDPDSIPRSGRSSGKGIGYPLWYSWSSLVAQLVKNLPVMWETWVRSLGWEDPLEKQRLPTSVFWPVECHGLYSPGGHKESDKTEWLSLTQSLLSICKINLISAFKSV